MAGGEEVSSAEPDTAADRMWHHFWPTVHARNAVVQGDLERAREALAEIEAGDYGIEVPQEWMEPLKDMQADAQRGVRAGDLAGVARGVAAVGLHCGECHRKVAERSVLPEGDTHGYRAHGRRGVTEAMARHQWAMEELWLGLTSPRHADWIRGADALADQWQPIPAPAPTDPSPGDAAASEGGAESVAPAPAPEVDAAQAERIRAIRGMGAELRAAQTPHARAKALGALFVECARCHTGS